MIVIRDDMRPSQPIPIKNASEILSFKFSPALSSDVCLRHRGVVGVFFHTMFFYAYGKIYEVSIHHSRIRQSKARMFSIYVCISELNNLHEIL